MQTKAYFASSVPAALEVARQELGENALLVSSKPAPPQARQFGRLEVTFAWDPVTPASRRADDPTLAKLHAMESATVAACDGTDTRDANASRRQASHRNRQRKSRPARLADPATRMLAVVDELASRIPTAPFVEMNAGESRTLAFIGPPGRGKTTH